MFVRWIKLLLVVAIFGCINFIAPACAGNSNVIFEGFSWAEQLSFDGQGSMFVSDAVTGKLWRIFPTASKMMPAAWNASSAVFSSKVSSDSGYDGVVHIYDQAAISSFGGLAIRDDGNLYAGVSFAEKNGYGIIVTSTAWTSTYASYVVLGKTTEKPNGLAADWSFNRLFYTYEGGSSFKGTVCAMDISTGKETVIASDINADGAWIDAKSQKLFIGIIQSMQIAVFDISTVTPVLMGYFDGAKARTGVHMLDDITVKDGSVDTSDINKTVVYGGDWTGKAVLQFNLDGTYLASVAVPEGVTLKEPTSVRFGKGPGFDENALYVSEGGGATDHNTARRIIRIPLK